MFENSFPSTDSIDNNQCHQDITRNSLGNLQDEIESCDTRTITVNKGDTVESIFIKNNLIKSSLNNTGQKQVSNGVKLFVYRYITPKIQDLDISLFYNSQNPEQSDKVTYDRNTGDLTIHQFREDNIIKTNIFSGVARSFLKDHGIITPESKKQKAPGYERLNQREVARILSERKKQVDSTKFIENQNGDFVIQAGKVTYQELFQQLELMQKDNIKKSVKLYDGDKEILALRQTRGFIIVYDLRGPQIGGKDLGPSTILLSNIEEELSSRIINRFGFDVKDFLRQSEYQQLADQTNQKVKQILKVSDQSPTLKTYRKKVEEYTQNFNPTEVIATYSLESNNNRKNVRELQDALAQLGYIGANGRLIKADGIYGENTEFAYNNAIRILKRNFSLAIKSIDNINNLEKAEVRELQLGLNLFGFKDKYDEVLELDGLVGPRTQYAFSEAQKQLGDNNYLSIGIVKTLSKNNYRHKKAGPYCGTNVRSAVENALPIDIRDYHMDGYAWEKYLDGRNDFIKVKVSPTQAEPGAILVYRKGKGRKTRSEYGHVEIALGNGKFYWKNPISNNPGGSVDATNNPEKSGYTGFAYYYTGDQTKKIALAQK